MTISYFQLTQMHAVVVLNMLTPLKAYALICEICKSPVLSVLEIYHLFIMFGEK